MNSFHTTKQKEIFSNLNITKYNVRDPLLSDCIGVGRACSSCYIKILGFNSTKDFGYALLTYFTARALNIPRMPFCEDRIYNKFYFLNRHDEEILLSLVEEKINYICSELVEIYRHTQECLKKTGLSYIGLRRELVDSNNQYINDILNRKVASDILEKNIFMSKWIH